VLGVPSNHDSRKRLENAMAAKTGWTIDVHCLERDSPWLHRLDNDGAGVWLLRSGRFTTTAVEVMDGKLSPTYVGRLGLRQFVRFLVSNLKVFALALHKRASITFPDLYDAAQRLWKLYLDFKRVAYDTCSRDKVVDKLEEVLSIDLSDLRALAQHCRAHLAVWSSKSQQTETSGGLPPVGPTVYNAVSEYASTGQDSVCDDVMLMCSVGCRIVRHSIHSEGLRQAVLDVVDEIEDSSVNDLDQIRVPEEILMYVLILHTGEVTTHLLFLRPTTRRLPKRPDDGSLHAPPLPMGRSNVRCAQFRLASARCCVD
jgi:hypothetical protein